MSRPLPPKHPNPLIARMIPGQPLPPAGTKGRNQVSSLMIFGIGPRANP